MPANSRKAKQTGALNLDVGKKKSQHMTDNHLQERKSTTNTICEIKSLRNIHPVIASLSGGRVSCHIAQLGRCEHLHSILSERLVTNSLKPHLLLALDSIYFISQKLKPRNLQTKVTCPQWIKSFISAKLSNCPCC